jgi:hypothetical protein
MNAKIKWLGLSCASARWDRQYDESRTKSAPVSVALPFQTIETLNESSQQRQKSIESFLTRAPRISDKHNISYASITTFCTKQRVHQLRFEPAGTRRIFGARNGSEIQGAVFASYVILKLVIPCFP